VHLSLWAFGVIQAWLLSEALHAAALGAVGVLKLDLLLDARVVEVLI